jgi:hypothetical protein
MPRRSYSPKQGFPLPYQIRPLPPERELRCSVVGLEVPDDDPAPPIDLAESPEPDEI